MTYQDKQKILEKWLLEPGNNFCTVPYTHMAIESNGDIRPCCMGKELTDENGQRLNINNKTINEALNHPVRQKFIDSFDKNQQHPACQACWGDNTRFLNRVKFSLQPQVIDITEQAMMGQRPERKLQWLEIKPGNRCNLKCRICGVHNSSSWTKDAYHLNNWFATAGHDFNRSDYSSNFKKSEELEYTKQCEWIDQENFWTDINGFEEIRLIHFMGGEPFMVTEHFQLLQALLDRGIDTKNITIRYNTNGTYFPNNDQLDILNKFGKKQVHLSIDDVGKRFEYQRKLAIWDQVKQNIEKFVSMKNQSWSIQVDPTVSIFNVWYLKEIETEFLKLDLALSRYNNHFVTQHRHDARVLPEKLLNATIKRCEQGNTPFLNNVVEFLKTPMPKQYNKATELHDFFDGTSFLDHARNEKFQEVFPEWYDRLEPYLTKTINSDKYQQYYERLKQDEQKNI